MPRKRMELALDRTRIVNLLSQNAAALREDMQLMEAKVLKVYVHGSDVTSEQAARLTANLTRIEQIIHAFERSEP